VSQSYLQQPTNELLPESFFFPMPQTGDGGGVISNLGDILGEDLSEEEEEEQVVAAVGERVVVFVVVVGAAAAAAVVVVVGEL